MTKETLRDESGNRGRDSSEGDCPANELKGRGVGIVDNTEDGLVTRSRLKANPTNQSSYAA